MDIEMLSILVPIPIVAFLIACIVLVIKGKEVKSSEHEVFDAPENPTQYSCNRSSIEPGDKYYVYGFAAHESINNN